MLECELKVKGSEQVFLDVWHLEVVRPFGMFRISASLALIRFGVVW